MGAPNRHHEVRAFVDSLDAGTRVIWIANGTRGTVQPDKSIWWDDGSHMTRKQLSDTHALLIHSEEEWQRMQESLTSKELCVRCGCTVERYEASAKKGGQHTEVCPIALLEDPDTGPVPLRRSVLPDTVRLAPARMRHRARA